VVAWAGEGRATLLSMAQNGKFGLSLRVLAYLAQAPAGMHTSAAIAEALETSPVMVRRVFAPLHEAGFITQRKGPLGGAQLKASAKGIGFGDVYRAVGGGWPSSGDKAADALLAKSRQHVFAAMNEITIAGLIKKQKKG
jgi:DNA-binding IscR family transcriptional regulator